MDKLTFINHATLVEVISSIRPSRDAVSVVSDGIHVQHLADALQGSGSLPLVTSSPLQTDAHCCVVVSLPWL